MTLQKPFSEACENNKRPILAILKEVFWAPHTVLEIGSGTGQHACYFARHMPHLQWQASDRPENIAGIRLWLEEAGLPNLKPAIILDINDQVWPCESIQALFTANTLHILSQDEVEIFFDRLSVYLNDGAIVCIYGPFNYCGEYTSDSNARFDQWLKQRNPVSGIKHFEVVAALAKVTGLALQADYPMPANNRLLVFERHIQTAMKIP